MVTQTVLHITTYGDIVAAAAVSPSSSAAVDVPPQNTSIKNVSKQLQTQSFNNESRTDSTQQPSQLGWTNGSKNYKPCGLIQLCCYSGCVNVANFTRGYGFCNLHQAESMAAEQRKNYSEDPQYDKCIRDASSHSHHGGFHTRSAYESKFPPRQVYNTGISLYNSEGSTDNAFSDGGCDSNSGRDDDSFDYASPEVEKKGALPSENFVSEKQVIKHQRCSAFTPNHEHQRCSTFTPFTTVTEPEPERERLDRLIMDLSGVPMQSPIPKRGKRINSSTSKYEGVSFYKRNRQWVARIMIERKAQVIGYYNSEEDAGIDYARAIFKYRGQEGLDEKRGQRSAMLNASPIPIDLSGVPMQALILKSGKGAQSKYQGVYFDKDRNKWWAQIIIGRKGCHIGSYDNEEDAARAVSKYRSRNEVDCNVEQAESMTGEQRHSGESQENASDKSISDASLDEDLSDSCSGHGGDSPAGGQTSLELEREDALSLKNSMGRNEVTKHKRCDEFNTDSGGATKRRRLNEFALQTALAPKAINKARAQDSFTIDLSDVPQQSPILRTEMKERTSQYQGVCFNKNSNKWQARIMIEGKSRYIGGYENEEDAAIDYARAVFKYRGRNETLDDCNSERPYSRTGEQSEVTQSQRSSTATVDMSDLSLRTPIKEGACQNETIDDCDMKLADPLAGEQSDLEEPADNTEMRLGNSKDSISDAKSDGELCDRNSAHDSKCPSDKIEEKRVLSNDPSEKEVTQQRSGAVAIENMPSRPLIAKSLRHGVCFGIFFDKKLNQWVTRITIEGKLQYIVYYESAEEAAADYARAVFKHKGQKGIEEEGEHYFFNIDLSDVPMQAPILTITEGQSKYQGVCFEKGSNKWRAQITIEGKERFIGCYDSEEDAAIDYARAVFKYRGRNGELHDCNSEQSESKAAEQRQSDDSEAEDSGDDAEMRLASDGVMFNRNSLYDSSLCPPRKIEEKGTLSSGDSTCGSEVTQSQRSSAATVDMSDLSLRTPIKEGACQNETIDDCDVKLVDPLADEQSDLDEPADNTKMRLGNSEDSISDAKSDGDLCDRNLAHDSKCPSDKIEEKRVLSENPSEKEVTHRQRPIANTIDLRDVPQQPLIAKNLFQEALKAKYKGVVFDQTLNKWVTTEENAAAAYFRAWMTFRGRANEILDPCNVEQTDSVAGAQSDLTGACGGSNTNEVLPMRLSESRRRNGELHACKLKQTYSVAREQRGPAEVFGESNVYELLEMRLSKSRHSISDSTSDEGRCDDSTCPSRKIEENSAIPSVAGEAPSPKTTPSPPESTIREEVVASPGNKPAKKIYCTDPECFLPLFARGKCYRHDLEQQQRENQQLASAAASAIRKGGMC